MLTYERYDSEMHRLFKAAYAIRCNADSAPDELLQAENLIEQALGLSAEMEQSTENPDMLNELIVDRLRCYIERLAIYSRLLKAAYGTAQFDTLYQRQEQLCRLYKHVYSHIENEEVKQSQYQLTVMAYQSLASGYFARSGKGNDKALCQQAIACLDRAMELTKGSKLYDVLQSNKLQILRAME